MAASANGDGDGRTLPRRPISDFSSIEPIAPPESRGINDVLGGYPELDSTFNYLDSSGNSTEPPSPAPAVKRTFGSRTPSALKSLELQPLAFEQPNLAGALSTDDINRTQSYETGTNVRVLGEPADFDPIRRTGTLGTARELQYRFRGSAVDIDALSQDLQIGNRTVQIIYPKNVSDNLDAPLLSVDSAVKGLGVLDDTLLAATKVLVINPNRNPDDIDWERQKGWANFRSQATGLDGVVNFYPTRANLNQSDVDATVIHEAGHVWNQLWKTTDSERTWANAIASDAKPPSKYALTAQGEDFAESLVMYKMSKGTKYETPARELFPARYRVLDTLYSSPPSTTPPSRNWLKF